MARSWPASRGAARACHRARPRRIGGAMSANAGTIRRWTVRLLLAGVAVFLILVALAAWIMRDQIFQTMLDPRVPYQTYEPPPAPDYASADAWAMRPEAEMEDGRPAVFVVHPTTYEGGEHWNAPHDRPQEAEVVARLSLPNWAGPFDSAGDIWAPRYRQASLYTFMNNREDSVQARLTAYQDVRRAFDRFLQEAGPDRPFIVVGVGQQGGMHALGALMGRVAPAPTIRERLAAAYIIDAPVPLDLFAGPLADLPPCESPEDIRCVIAWAAATPAETARVEALMERAMTWTADGELAPMEGRSNLCVNPLSWARTDDYAPARLHRGGAAAEGFDPGETPSPLSGQTGAQCENGVLMIERPRSQTLRRPDRLGEDRREPPFNLFYADMEMDAGRRAALLAEALEHERTYAPELPEAEPIEIDRVIPIDPQ
ncbi:DUF3089 domain-containing protein [Glycocaulis profundi]|nr:DUF3089 domain-containing protein [Glycocaulis profundi]